MLLLTILLAPVQVQDGDAVAAAMANYREKTRAEINCRRDPEEITVCAARDADRWRVPLVASANVKNSVPTRTATLLEDVSQPACGNGAFLLGCGMVGATMTVGFDGKVRYVERELAP